MVYSLEEEEPAILKWFGNYVGRFLDIGAYDGVTYSNTRELVERGWTGVLAEPDPRSFVKLIQNCRGKVKLTLVNVALSSEGGFRVFFSSPSENDEKFPLRGNAGALSTLDVGSRDHWGKKVGGLLYDEMYVRVVSVNEFLSVFKPPFDFVTIDTEGLDWDILHSVEVGVFGASLLCIEKNSNREEIIGHCECGGYKLVYETSANVLMGRKRKSGQN